MSECEVLLCVIFALVGMFCLMVQPSRKRHTRGD